MNASRTVQTVSTPQAPKAIGPYSQAVSANGFLFVSGQLPLDPGTGEMAAGGIEERTHQCLQNIQAIARAAGTDLNQAVKVNVYLTDMSNFSRVNDIYGQYFPEDPPARLAIQVAALPKQADIEIEAVLALSS